MFDGYRRALFFRHRCNGPAALDRSEHLARIDDRLIVCSWTTGVDLGSERSRTPEPSIDLVET
jgi:hypothetical protein